MHDTFTFGSLFSGCLGLDLGLEAVGGRCLWACENDKHATAVINARRPGLLVVADVHDVGAGLPRPDVLAGGFPCQDISQAGRRAGLAHGTRSGLWYEFARTIRELRPRVVLVENVRRLRTAGLDVVLGDLADAGYDAHWACVRAADVGAPHRRERFFIVASDASGAGRRQVAGGASRDEGTAGWPQDDHVSGGAGTLGLQTAAAADADRDGSQGSGSGDETGRCVPPGGRPSVADAGGDGLVRQPSLNRAYEGVEVEPRHDADGRDLGDAGPDDGHDGETTTEWGVYTNAVRQWERLFAPAPQPTDDRGRLNPRFAEWMMGFPYGWVDVGISRTQQLKLIGNAVQVQVGAVVGLAVLQTCNQQEV